MIFKVFDDISVKISFVYDVTSEVPEATSHDITYEPVSCHGQLNGCTTEM